MSFHTWRDEFYQTPANELAAGTVRDVISNSLTKWQGLTRKAITKHGLEKAPGTRMLTMGGITVFGVDCDACSLCYAAKRATYPLVGPEMSIEELTLSGFGDQHCKNCLLAHYGEKKGCIPEYVTFVMESDPQPMICLLSKALAGAIEAGHCDILAKDAV